MERKPGRKKAWSVLEKMEKSLVSFFFSLIHGEVKLTDYFNQLPFQPFDLKLFFGTHNLFF